MSELNVDLPEIVSSNYQRPARQPTVSGTVTHPSDLQPAIDALSEMGRAWLNKRCEGRAIAPRDLALAGDFERGELK